MTRIVVTGPPASGTALVAAALAARFRARFLDGDEIYPQTTRRTRDATPAQRHEMWLNALAAAFARDASLVVASAPLTRGERDAIRARIDGVVFAEVVAVPEQPQARRWWRRRPDADAAAPSIPVADVDALAADEPGVRVAADADLESVVTRIATVLEGQSLR